MCCEIKGRSGSCLDLVTAFSGLNGRRSTTGYAHDTPAGPACKPRPCHICCGGGLGIHWPRIWRPQPRSPEFRRQSPKQRASNPALCSCFCLSVSALQSVLPVGVWRTQRCYYVATTACRRRHFQSAFLRTARQSCGQESLSVGGKSPKKAFNRLFHTLCLKYHSVGTVSVLLRSGFFV